MQACATGDTKPSSDAEAEKGAATPIVGIRTHVPTIRAMLRFIAHHALLAGLVIMTVLRVSFALTSIHIG
jgi:hypothetical protein